MAARLIADLELGLGTGRRLAIAVVGDQQDGVIQFGLPIRL